MLKTRTWIALFAVLALLLALLSLLLYRQRGEGTVAEILQDGAVIREIDLSRVLREESFRVEWEGGYNIVTLRPGAICVSEADCPDQICVHMGWLRSEAAPIVCLPHRLMIRLKGGAADAESQ
jgi:hypothetical protein